jgi:hypothetical protein
LLLFLCFPNSRFFLFPLLSFPQILAGSTCINNPVVILRFAILTHPAIVPIEGAVLFELPAGA